MFLIIGNWKKSNKKSNEMEIIIFLENFAEYIQKEGALILFYINFSFVL